VVIERKGFRFRIEYDSRCWLEGGQHLMVRPISNDLRKRVVTAVSKGESCRSAAVRFGVAVSSVVKWSQRYRSTGSIAPGKMGGHRKPVLDPHRAFIVKRLSQTPHLTLHALKDELAARGARSRTIRFGGSCGGKDFGSKKRCLPLSKAAPILPAETALAIMAGQPRSPPPSLHR
jgi:'Paired box' domain